MVTDLPSKDRPEKAAKEAEPLEAEGTDLFTFTTGITQTPPDTPAVNGLRKTSDLYK